MNAVTQTEARAVNAAAAIPLEAADPTKNLLLVPLSRLVSLPAGRNARKTPPMSLPALAPPPPPLPAAVADAQGVASTTWTVPADFPVGEHTVIFDSGSATYKATFTVVASEAEQGNGSALTPTGSDSAAEMLAGVAIMTMLSAGVLLLARRRSLANSGR